MGRVHQTSDKAHGSQIGNLLPILQKRNRGSVMGHVTCPRSHCWLVEEVLGLNFTLHNCFLLRGELRGLLTSGTGGATAVGTLSLEKRV